jgi:hypothetical protein
MQEMNVMFGSAKNLKRMRIGIFVIMLTFFAMILDSCSGVQRKKEAHSGLTIEKLRNAEYQSAYMTDGKARLTDGICRKKIMEDSAAEIVVRLTENIAFGELNWGLNAAAVILQTDTGGSGAFTDLAIVINDEDTLENVASVFLGDRVKVQSLVIENGQVVLQIITHGPHDPMCCPTREVTKNYGLRGHRLIELPIEK